MVKGLVVVTGGSGFIGVNLTLHLMNLGYDVVNFDIRPPRCSAVSASYVFLDVNDREALLAGLARYKPKVLINLAARTDLLGEDLSAYQVNVQGVENVCRGQGFPG